VGRYASAPDLQALAVETASRPAAQQVIPDPTPARAPPPGSPSGRGVARTLSSSQASPQQRPWSVAQKDGKASYTDRPTLGVPSELQASDKAHYVYVHKVMHAQRRQTAQQRLLRRSSKFLVRNWMFLLVLGMSMAGMWLAAGYRPHAKLGM